MENTEKDRIQKELLEFIHICEEKNIAHEQVLWFIESIYKRIHLIDKKLSILAEGYEMLTGIGATDKQ